MNESNESVENVGLPLEPEAIENGESEVEHPSEVPSPDEMKKLQAVAEEQQRILNVEVPSPTVGGAPPWAKLPAGMVFPRGKQILFLKFKSSWTDTPLKGAPCVKDDGVEFELDSKGNPILYRQCVVWPISGLEKRLAIDRARQDPNRYGEELAKQMLRVVDGHRVDWTEVHADGVEQFWNEIGEKCRTLVGRIFSQLHILDVENTRDFLQHCVVVRST